MIKEADKSPTALLDWVQCVLTLGSTGRCEGFAMKIVDLQAIWTAETILSILGIKLFVFEASRKFPSKIIQFLIF